MIQLSTVIILLWICPLIVISFRHLQHILVWNRHNYNLRVFFTNWHIFWRQNSEKWVITVAKVNFAVLALVGLFHHHHILAYIGLIGLISLWVNQTLNILQVAYKNRYQKFNVGIVGEVLLGINLLILISVIILLIDSSLGLSTHQFTNAASLENYIYIFQFVYLSIITAVLFEFSIPIVVFIELILIKPLIYFLELYRRRLAMNRLIHLMPTHTIVVMGDKGKSVVTQTLRHIYSDALNVATTPAAINDIPALTEFILSIPPQKLDILVIELHDWAAAEASEIAEVIKADIGVLTSIDPDTSVIFGDRLTLLESKLNLLEKIIGTGKLIVNIDDELDQTIIQRSNLQEIYISANSQLPYLASPNLQVNHYVLKDKYTEEDTTTLVIKTASNSFNVQLGFNPTKIINSFMCAIATAMELDYADEPVFAGFTTLDLNNYSLEITKADNGAKILYSNSRPTITSYTQDLAELVHEQGLKVWINSNLNFVKGYKNNPYPQILTQLKQLDKIVTQDLHLVDYINHQQLEVEVLVYESDNELLKIIDRIDAKYAVILIANDIDKNIVNYIIEL